MNNIYKFKWIILFAGLIFISLLLIIWLKPKNPDSQPNSNIEKSQDFTPTSNEQNLTSTPLTGQNFAALSQQDTQINCQLSSDANNHLIVNENTKNCFEYFITQYGEKTLEQLKADFIAYSKATYQEPLLSQLLDLWHRYIQYREQIGNLQQPNIQQDDPKYYESIFNQMKQIKKRFFSDYEIEGLFGHEDTYNDYTIKRMIILNHQTLTEAEKAAKLEQLFKDLPQDWQDNLKQLNQVEDLRRLTSDIKARGGSAQEIREMRLNLVGAEATQRLEQLDTKRKDWKNKVTEYLTQRDTINKSSMSDTAKNQAIEKIRQSYFPQSHEQIRVQTFESLHDKGQPLPLEE